MIRTGKVLTCMSQDNVNCCECVPRLSQFVSAYSTSVCRFRDCEEDRPQYIAHLASMIAMAIWMEVKITVPDEGELLHDKEPPFSEKELDKWMAYWIGDED